MRYLRVAVHLALETRHPMHQFVVEREGYTVSRLLETALGSEDDFALLFHVEGDPEPYERVLADLDRIIEYELSPCADDSFYLYVREALSEREQAFVGAFSQPGLLVVMPIEYRADGTVRLTAVGPAGRLQTAVDATPEGMDIEVLEVGEYDARQLDAAGGLTDRQFEAVVAAVEVGYYETPREGSVAEVADRLDCTPGTAAELLRRAESTVMSHLVSAGPF